jgi:hypothetical protein
MRTSLVYRHQSTPELSMEASKVDAQARNITESISAHSKSSGDQFNNETGSHSTIPQQCACDSTTLNDMIP